jgi:hypothetical protein
MPVWLRKRFWPSKLGSLLLLLLLLSGKTESSFFSSSYLSDNGNHWQRHTATRNPNNHHLHHHHGSNLASIWHKRRKQTAYKLLSDDSFRTLQQIGATSGSRPARVRARLGCKHVRNEHPHATNDNELSGWGSDRLFTRRSHNNILWSEPVPGNIRFNLSDPDLVEAWHIYNVFRSKLNKFKKKFEFFGLGYQGKDIVFRFIIEYSSLMDFGP